MKTSDIIKHPGSRQAWKVWLLAVSLVVMLVGAFVLLLHFRPKRGEKSKTERIVLTDTVGMKLADGGIYNGSIIKGTTMRHGVGCLVMPDNVMYEGKWRNDALPYGKMTTNSSVYYGRFDKQLNLEGFGIMKYKETYIAGKRNQGLSDDKIVAKFFGNWRRNMKHGLGRAVYLDGSQDFGDYSEGVLKETKGADFRVGEKVYGIDVSRHQADIDWDRLALFCDKDGTVFRQTPAKRQFMQPVLFVYIKATEGATLKDKTYKVRSIEADRHGIVKGAYHFLRMGSSVDEQVKNFVAAAAWREGDLPPALDIEVESEIRKVGVKKAQAITLRWLESVEEFMGVRPIIYTREDLRKKYLSDARFRKYDFWIARYSKKRPNNPDWRFWQMTENGVLNGYSGGRIDINLFSGNYEAFENYLNGRK